MVRKTKAEAEQTRLQIIEAARNVFFQRGVSRSTLDEIACAAGVTRGAVYWHFQNKPELFFAMREQSEMPFLSRPVAQFLDDETVGNPLEAIEAALLKILDLVQSDEAVRITLEILVLRCEYVDDFAPVLGILVGSHERLLKKLEGAYRRAARRGFMRRGLKPDVLALETLVFVSGLIHRWLAVPGCRAKPIWAQMIRSHVRVKLAEKPESRATAQLTNATG